MGTGLLPRGRRRGAARRAGLLVRCRALDCWASLPLLGLLLAGQHVKTVLQVEVQDGAVPTLTFETDQTALARLVAKQLGKTILFTDNDDWTNEEIVLGYRSQHHLEDAFR